MIQVRSLFNLDISITLDTYWFDCHIVCKYTTPSVKKKKKKDVVDKGPPLKGHSSPSIRDLKVWKGQNPTI